MDGVWQRWDLGRAQISANKFKHFMSVPAFCSFHAHMGSTFPLEVHFLWEMWSFNWKYLKFLQTGS